MFKNCPQWKSQQKTPLGNRPGGDQQASGPNPGERQHQDRRAVCRRAVQPGDLRLSRDNRRRKDGRPTGGRRVRRRAGEASEWGNREREEQLALSGEEEESPGGEE